MVKTLALINQKGGVGKSTTAVNLAYEFALAKQRTLLIDLDPQAHSSCIYCLDVDKSKTIGTIFTDKEIDLTSIIRKTIVNEQPQDLLHVIPSTIHLALTAETANSKIFKEKFIKKLIDKISHVYDYIIIDCQPTLGILAINAIFAANVLLIPTNFEKYSLDGISDLLQSIKAIKVEQEYTFYILRNLYERRNTQTNRFINQQLTDNVRPNLLDTVIKKNEAINQSQINGVPVKVFNPKSSGAHDFEQLRIELMSHA